ncbi:MAG: hypothetical protein JNL32_00095 [Candidatus Kapabacteria bacterium]|nr:hypothetical protein [Candidatus Kapabacteria bacterium]
MPVDVELPLTAQPTAEDLAQIHNAYKQMLTMLNSIDSSPDSQEEFLVIALHIPAGGGILNNCILSKFRSSSPGTALINTFYQRPDIANVMKNTIDISIIARNLQGKVKHDDGRDYSQDELITYAKQYYFGQLMMQQEQIRKREDELAAKNKAAKETVH